MSQLDIQVVWAETKEHVDNTLSQASSHTQMLRFVDAMCDYYKNYGCREVDVKELRLLMGAKCLHYALNLKSKDEKIMEEYKKVLYDPENEGCIVVGKTHIP